MIAAIESAFATVTLGDGITIHEARALDDYEDARAARAVDCHVRWQDISDNTLRALNDVHCFLDDAGYRYYTPAYMRWVLRHLDDETDDHRSLDWSFMYSLDPGFDASRHRRMATFDAAQRTAVCLFLRHLVRAAGGHRDDAEQALVAHWGRYCDAGPSDDDDPDDFRRTRLGR
ncbi:MAG TPA: DUF6714 family protein [Humisphaera sp.]